MDVKPNVGHYTLREAAEIPEHPSWRTRLRGLLGAKTVAEPPQASAQPLPDPRVFQPTDEGSGIFGTWMLDKAGLPAYEYTCDQYEDERAAYPNSENLDRRDHWHQVGNQRITALASNDGIIQVYLGDRGGVLLNRFEAWEYERPDPGLRALLYRLTRWLVQWATRIFQKYPGLTPFAVPAQSADMPIQNCPRGMISPEILSQWQAERGGVTPQGVSSSQVKHQHQAPAARYAFTGGYSYLYDGEVAWASAFRYRMPGTKQKRIFGTGYFETESTYRDIRIVRNTYAPYGDFPLLLTDVKIENLRTQPVILSHYEYWDVNIYQLQLEWLRTGHFGAVSDDRRREINRHFQHTMEWMDDAATLCFKQAVHRPPPAQFLEMEKSCDINWHPPHVFLTDLSGQPDAFYVYASLFFGAGGARQPDAVRQHKASDQIGAEVVTDAIPYCMVLRRDVHLKPGEIIHLRYAYGTLRPDENLNMLDMFRQPAAVLDQTMQDWKTHLAYFTTGQDHTLQREMYWHAYNLLSSTVYNAFHNVHLIPQGSAYLYLHGADGAPRDQALFTLPMTYLNPNLARDMLRLIMRLTDAKTGQIAYAFAGHGIISDGMGIHTKPSDLDLFFLLAMGEYLSATGDFGFLNEEVPFYPSDENTADNATVLDHIRTAVEHIFEGIGTGDNGLIKVGSGDWSDSIVLETALSDGVGPFGATYQNSKAHGESVMNSQMALYILPLIAALIAPYDAQLSDYIYDRPKQPDRLERLKEAVANQWDERGWYKRAILRGHSNQQIEIKHFCLESQPWALISRLAHDEGREAELIERIDEQLDRPSPIGATLVEKGMVWPAVSQLMTWAYARCGRDQLAWRSLNRNTFAAHSLVYPAVWLNTWSGPDGINGLSAQPEQRGGTWSSPITPMTDFPVMNANQDAMALLGLLRVCGIEPAPNGDGLVIHPHVPRERFKLVMPLLSLEVQPGHIAGRYRAVAAGSRKLYVHVPPGAVNIAARVQDVSILDAAPNAAGQVELPLVFVADQIIIFEVKWQTLPAT